MTRDKAIERLAAVLHNCPLGEMVISVCEREFSYLEPEHQESLREDARRLIRAIGLMPRPAEALVAAVREAKQAADSHDDYNGIAERYDAYNLARLALADAVLAQLDKTPKARTTPAP